jgi:hypothetical protein
LLRRPRVAVKIMQRCFPLLDVVIRLYDSGRISAYSIDNGLHLWSVNSQLTTSTSAFAEAGRLLFAVDDDMMAAFRVGKSASVVTVTAVSHVDSLVLFLECGPPCLHGKCNQTGSCVCQSGYIGVACDSCSGEQPVRCTMGTCGWSRESNAVQRMPGTDTWATTAPSSVQNGHEFSVWRTRTRHLFAVRFGRLLRMQRNFRVGWGQLHAKCAQEHRRNTCGGQIERTM